MQESVLIKKISAKKVSKEAIAEEITKNPSLLPEIFEGLKHNKADIKYGCDKILRILSENYPAMLYPHIDFFIKNLENDNNIFKWSAILIIANLSAVDIFDKVDRIIDYYLMPVEGHVLITAANTIKGAAKIAVHKPSLADIVSAALLKVSSTNYETEECNNIAAGTAIEAFEKIYDLVKDKSSLIEFAEKHTENPRTAVKKKALLFIKKHSIVKI